MTDAKPGRATIIALALLPVTPVHAASDLAAIDQGGPSEGDPIVVIAKRIIEVLADIGVERTFESDEVASYGVGSVGEVIDAIEQDNGDSDPVILVDGRPIVDRADIDNFPPEAIARVELLPRGSAARVGGGRGERVYNVVLKPSVRTAVLSASRRFATEGGTSEGSSEANLTWIKGRDRLNLTFGQRDTGMLTEVERDVIRPTVGSIDERPYRSLRPDTLGFDSGFTGALRLASWLDLQGNGRIAWSHDEGLSGVEGGLPLTTRYRAKTGNIATTLLATSAQWQGTLGARYDVRDTEFAFDRAFVDPTSGTPDIRRDRIGNRTKTALATATVNGPLLQLPAGMARLRVSADATHVTFDVKRSGAVSSRRRNKGVGIGLSAPVFDNRTIGKLVIDGDVGHSWLSDRGELDRWSAGANWQPRRWLQLTGNLSQTETAIEPELLAGQVYVVDGVLIFDPARNETVEVSQRYGGNPDLRTPTIRLRRLAISAAPLSKLNLQLNASYSDSRATNLIGAVPAASLGVLAAFPERFVRDGEGRLILVDSRPANFKVQRQEQLQYGIAMTVPLYSNAGGVPNAIANAAKPVVRVNATHGVVLADRIEVRDGLPAIDMLHGGAIGIGGGRVRHILDTTLVLADRDLGIQLDGKLRGPAYLSTGSSATPQMLRFGSLTLFNLRAFSGLGRIFPESDFASKGRVTIAVTNVTGQRQKTSSETGSTPFAYQPVYRDPVGRTANVEVRFAF